VDETAPVYYITTLARGHNPPQSMGAAPCGHQFARSFSHLASSFRACPFLPTAPTSPQMLRPCGHAGLAHRATCTAVPARAALAWPRRFLPVSFSGHTHACTGRDHVGIARALQGCCNVLGLFLFFCLRLETKTETKMVLISRD